MNAGLASLLKHGQIVALFSPLQWLERSWQPFPIPWEGASVRHLAILSQPVIGVIFIKEAVTQDLLPLVFLDKKTPGPQLIPHNIFLFLFQIKR
jgi:hypothetical protein